MNNQKGNDKTVLVNISLLIGNLIVINTQSDDTAEIIEDTNGYRKNSKEHIV